MRAQKEASVLNRNSSDMDRDDLDDDVESPHWKQNDFGRMLLNKKQSSDFDPRRMQLESIDMVSGPENIF